MTVTFGAPLLSDTVKPGAGVTGESVLNYCEDVGARLKRVAYQESEQYKELLSAAMKEEIEKDIPKIKTEISKIKNAADALRSLDELNQFYVNKESLITIPTGNEPELLTTLLTEWAKSDEDVRIYSEADEPKLLSSEHTEDEMAQMLDEPETFIPIDSMIEKLDLAASYLGSEKNFERITHQLEQKSARLKEQKLYDCPFWSFQCREIIICQCVA